MKRAPSRQPGIGLDANKLRAARLRKRWTQRQLAEQVGFSEDYVNQLERSWATRNKGEKLETILRFAQALEMAPEELLQVTSNGAPPELTTHQLQTYAAILGTGKPMPHEPELSAWHQKSALSPSRLIPQGSAAAEGLVKEVLLLNLQGHWMQAAEKALQARACYPEGSEEWALITLQLCAQAHQQAGDVIGAKAYIREVQQRYLAVTDHPNPRILAHLRNQQGWLATEQFGQFPAAYEEFTQVLQHALEADDLVTKTTAHHFRLRVLSEVAMTESGAWLVAQPVRALSTARLRMLHQSLKEDWPASCALDPINIHSYNRRFIVNALIQPGEAQRLIPELLDQARQTSSEHIIALNLARWHLSQQQWEQAEDQAGVAFEGYCQAAYPSGIALAAAIGAVARLQQGLKTFPEAERCQDGWVLALLLHPYDSHPLAAIARRGLDQTVELIAEREETWLQSYFEDLDIRVWRKEGAFEHSATSAERQPVSSRPGFCVTWGNDRGWLRNRRSSRRCQARARNQRAKKAEQSSSFLLNGLEKSRGRPSLSERIPLHVEHVGGVLICWDTQWLLIGHIHRELVESNVAVGNVVGQLPKACLAQAATPCAPGSKYRLLR